MGEGNVLELNRKVEKAMEDDYDIKQGVNPNRERPLPIKANIDLWSYQARQSFLSGNYTAAMMMYNKCINYDPTDGRAWLGLARIYWKKRDNQLAEKSYKDGLYYSPNNPFLLQGYAVMLEKLGRISESMKLLITSVKYNPKHAASWIALANLYKRDGLIDNAKQCYVNAIEGDSQSYVAYQALAVLEANRNNVDNARELFKKALSISNKSIYALQAWANMEKRIGNYDEAERILSIAMRVMPSSTRVRQLCASLYELKGELIKARQIFQDGAKYAIQYGDAGFFQSWALFEDRHYHILNKLTNKPINNLSNQSNQSTNYPNNYQYTSKIRNIYKTAIKINKFHSPTWIAWAKFEERLGNLDLSRRLLVSGVSQFPHSKNIAWFHCALGHLASLQNDLNTARACYQRALDSSSINESKSILLEYANCEEYHGNKKEAKKLYELGISRYPKDDNIWSLYIQLERKRTNSYITNDFNYSQLFDIQSNDSDEVKGLIVKRKSLYNN